MRESHSRQKRLVISACAFPVLGGPALRGTEAEDKDGRHRELTWEAQPGTSSGMSPTLYLAPFPAVVPELSLLGVRGLRSGRWNAQGSVCLFVGLFSVPTVHSWSRTGQTSCVEGTATSLLSTLEVCC